MPGRFHVVDGTKQPAAIEKDIWKTVKKLVDTAGDS
jgi:hypothetical protein